MDMPRPGERGQLGSPPRLRTGANQWYKAASTWVYKAQEIRQLSRVSGGSHSLRHLVSAAAGSPDISQKAPEFLGFRARVFRRRPSPRGRDRGIAAAVSIWQFCGSVSLLTGNLQGFWGRFSGDLGDGFPKLGYGFNGLSPNHPSALTGNFFERNRDSLEP